MERLRDTVFDISVVAAPHASLQSLGLEVRDGSWADLAVVDEGEDSVTWRCHHDSRLVSSDLAILIWPSFIRRNRVVNHRSLAVLIFHLLKVWQAR